MIKIGDEFQIKTGPVKRDCERFSSIQKEMQRLCREIVACRMGLAVSGAGGERLKRRLGELHDQVLEQAGRLESFRKALEQIILLYSACEEEILSGMRNPGGSGQAGESGTEKRGGWLRFWDWLFNRKDPDSYTATSGKQEEKADRELKETIENLTESERYSEENWAGATLEERKAILQDYMQEVAKILDVDIEKEITFTNTPPDENGVYNLGAYSHSIKTVKMNQYILENDETYDSYRLMTTVVHELRHAYQHAAIDDPERYQVSQETIDAWKESFATYAQEKAKGYQSYRNIIIEKDARQFAGQE